MQGGTTYTFVTGGVEAALKLARAAAGDKNIGIWGGANIIRQFLKAGLLDEMQIHLIPLLLGNGIRLFDDLDSEGIELRKTGSIETPGATHFRFEVVKTSNNISTPVKSGYALVNGLEMYYEIHGAKQDNGLPLILLHGAFSSIEPDFAQMLPIFTRTRQVIAVEQQAHGHTADIDRPLRTEHMAEDTVLLLRHLGIEKADFFGYSMGSDVAMKLAYHHPEMVRKLVLAGGVAYNLDGLHPGMMEGLDNMPPDALDGTPWKEAYDNVAPRPEDWSRFVAKKTEMDRNYQPWTQEQVQSFKTPMLIMVGDSDIVQPEHVIDMFRLVGGGVVGDLVGLPASQLAILPGTTHVTLVYRADWVTSMTIEFLD
jgi:pimeloyl-ACP methyl ester carboxylesterase